MIFVDSNVWIDFFDAKPTLQALRLEALIGSHEICTGDLVLAEVLQGIADDRMFERTRRLLTTIPIIGVCSAAIAVEAARNYRLLRAMGITVRQTIDTLIATRCIHNDLPLLSRDRDFLPFVEHLGLRDAMAAG
ncbi:type II toxin-antitoxin system VapC family toxin [Sphingomonas sp. 37zxx]|uniref:type II toxin-antitoxin system VapC family toxin n=1 Tax=Sphingomonas sp. 37zxx TaxID=1550073 RepID=UPI00053BFE9E|nr:PIN domain nuclease [Sphingomonas sp. 37zxx]